MLRKLHPQAGSRPGTLVIPADAEPTELRVIRFSPELLEDSAEPQIRSLTRHVRSDAVNWIQVTGLRDAETLVHVARQFGIHPLVIEDVVNGPQRPKSEPYDNHHLLIVRAPNASQKSLTADRQVSLIVGQGFLISFQSQRDELLEPVVRRLQRPGARLRRNGADYLAYAILDTIVDAFYPRIEHLTEQLQALEEAVLRCPKPEHLRELSEIKRQLVRLRHVVWAQSEMVATLLRDETPLIDSKVRKFLRDTHDHCIQISEAVDMCRETVTGLVNTYLSSVGQHTNEVMKTLTIVGSIFIPLTFVAGIYGMNFSHMPELEMPYAYPIAWITMMLIAGVMLWYFRRKGWLGSPSLAESLADATEQLAAPHPSPMVIALDYEESDTPSSVPYSAAG
jgi:magnesium transporter